MQYYNYRIDRKYIGVICLRTLASLPTKEQIGVLIYLILKIHELLLLWSDIT
jgi:hypothetical protein